MNPGRYSHTGFEVHGREGSIAFNWERFNELEFCSMRDEEGRHGFRTIYPGPEEPLGELFWPVPGYGVGYAETRMVQMLELCRAIGGEGEVQTTFLDDGWRNCAVTDAALRSVQSRSWTTVAQ
jgi:hypothetical protein